MRLKGFDLNLMVVFDLLIETRSVSRTAEQLNVSQPAVSSALRRLRDFFGDDILVPHGKRMLPTANAERMIGQVREALRIVDELITASTAFDPATTQRHFVLCASDYIATTLFVPLVRRLAAEAPHVRLELFNNDQRTWSQLEQGKIDLIITPEDYAMPDMPSEPLFDETHVVVGWAENPLFARDLDEDAFLAAGHVQVVIDYSRTTTFGDRQIARLGKTRRVEMTASSFTILPQLLVGTQWIATMQERLARLMARHYPLALAPLPFAIPAMRETMQFHPARTADTGLAWLRDQLREQTRIDRPGRPATDRFRIAKASPAQ